MTVGSVEGRDYLSRPLSYAACVALNFGLALDRQSRYDLSLRATLPGKDQKNDRDQKSKPKQDAN
jgi:hypothetical protein